MGFVNSNSCREHWEACVFLNWNFHLLFTGFQYTAFLPKELMFTQFWLNIFITIWKKIIFQRRTFGVGAKLGSVVRKKMCLTDSLQRNKAEEIRQSFPLIFLCFQLKGLQFQGFQFFKIWMPNMFTALLSPRRIIKIIETKFLPLIFGSGHAHCCCYC